MVGSDHFHQLWLDNMPQFLVGKAPFFDANWYNEEREFGLPRMRLAGDEDLAALPAAGGPGRRLRPGLQQRAADRPQRDLPDHHPAAAGGPADRAGLHQHLRAADAPALAVRRAGPGAAADGRGLAVGQAGGHHRHRAPVAGARRPAPVRPARPRPGIRPQGGGLDRQRRRRRLPGRGHAGQPARPRQRHPRVHGLHADDGRGRRRREGRLHRQPGPVPHHGGLLHLVPGRSARREQVPAGQVPVHGGPRSRAGRALPVRSGRDRGLVGAGDGRTPSSTATARRSRPGWRSPRRSAAPCASTTTWRCSSWAPTRS